MVRRALLSKVRVWLLKNGYISSHVVYLGQPITRVIRPRIDNTKELICQPKTQDETGVMLIMAETQIMDELIKQTMAIISIIPSTRLE